MVVRQQRLQQLSRQYRGRPHSRSFSSSTPRMTRESGSPPFRSSLRRALKWTGSLKRLHWSSSCKHSHQRPVARNSLWQSTLRRRPVGSTLRHQLWRRKLGGLVRWSRRARAVPAGAAAGLHLQRPSRQTPMCSMQRRPSSAKACQLCLIITWLG